MMDYRTEKDTLGQVKVPAGAYYGAQTQRAVENFPVSGLRLPPAFIWAQAAIKHSAAKANAKGGGLKKELAVAVAEAAEEVLSGKFNDQFIVDVFQAGAGTSQNMNINEVLANRAEEILGGKLGQYKLIHPNDHVNLGQSTNDTIPSAIHVSAYRELERQLLPELDRLIEAFAAKAKEFNGIVKTGRTHLQDAVPVRLGQEFGAYAALLEKSAKRITESMDGLLELPLGGSAVGSGLNTVPGYLQNVYKFLNQISGYKFRPGADLFAAMQGMDTVLELSASLRGLASNLSKIADDLRLLSSGPRTGLAEIVLPAVQPGSSIMPGKVNPVLAEMLNQVCFHIYGCDAAIAHAARSGQLELNVMMPLLAHELLQEIAVLAGGMRAFCTRCVSGIQANAEACLLYAEQSPALATALVPLIGYQRAAELAKEALQKKVLIRDLVLQKKLMSKEKVDKLLDLMKMTQNPGEKL